MSLSALLACLAGAAAVYVLYALFMNWRAFRRDDAVTADGVQYSFAVLFEDISGRIGLDGKLKALVKYSFLKSRRQIAAYQAREHIPIEAAVAFFMAGSARSYAKSMEDTEPNIAEAFAQAAARAIAYGETFTPSEPHLRPPSERSSPEAGH